MNDIPTSPQPSASRLAVWAIGWRSFFEPPRHCGLGLLLLAIIVVWCFRPKVPRTPDGDGAIPEVTFCLPFVSRPLGFSPIFSSNHWGKSDSDSHLSWLGVLWKHGVCMQISLQIHIPGCLVNIDIQKDVLGIHIYTQMYCTVCIYWYTSMKIKVHWCLYIYIDILIIQSIYFEPCLPSLVLFPR